MPPSDDLRVGREAFGADPAGYHGARPAYPEWVWELLADRCGLLRGCVAFEIGPGSGLATEELLARGVGQLLLIEPDHRLADFLAARLPKSVIDIRRQPFDEVELPDAAFDLGCAFTSFHWLDQGPALRKARDALRPGGGWATVWNVFGDPDRADPFHDATVGILQTPPRSPSEGGSGDPVFALDTEARCRELAEAGFVWIEAARADWTLPLDPAGVRALYGTFSGITTQTPDRQASILDRLAEVAEREFAGRVNRNMVTIAYTARRP